MSEMYRCKILKTERVTSLVDDEVMANDEHGDQAATWAAELLGLEGASSDWQNSWTEYVEWLRAVTAGRTKGSLLASLREAGWGLEARRQLRRDPSALPWETRADSERGATPAWVVLNALAALGHTKPVPALRVECELVTMHCDASRLLPELDRWPQLSAFGARLLAEANEGALEESPVVRDLVGADTYALWGPGEHEYRAHSVVLAARIAAQQPLQFRDEAWFKAQGRRWWTSRSERVKKFVTRVSEQWVRDIEPAQWSVTTLVLYAHPSYLPAPRAKPFNSCAVKAC